VNQWIIESIIELLGEWTGGFLIQSASFGRFAIPAIWRFVAAES